jgi:hypothetical protein
MFRPGAGRCMLPDRTDLLGHILTARVCLCRPAGRCTRQEKTELVVHILTARVCLCRPGAGSCTRRVGTELVVHILTARVCMYCADLVLVAVRGGSEQNL